VGELTAIFSLIFTDWRRSTGVYLFIRSRSSGRFASASRRVWYTRRFDYVVRRSGKSVINVITPILAVRWSAPCAVSGSTIRSAILTFASARVSSNDRTTRFRVQFPREIPVDTHELYTGTVLFRLTNNAYAHAHAGSFFARYARPFGSRTFPSSANHGAAVSRPDTSPLSGTSTHVPRETRPGFVYAVCRAFRSWT